MQNDNQDTASFTVFSSYVNTEPVLYEKNFKVNKRESLEIELSDIFKNYTLSNNGQLFLKINKQDAKAKEDKK